MATISQRISIEGGDDVRKALEELGKAASDAFKQIADAGEKVKLDPETQKSFDGLVEASSKLADQFTELGKTASQAAPEIEKVGEGATKADEGFAALGESGTKAAAAISSVSDASEKAADDTAKAGDAANKSSEGYANLTLNVIKTGAAIVSAGGSIASAGTATASLAAQTVTAAAAVGTFAISLGSVLVPAVLAAVGVVGKLGSALADMATTDAKLSDVLEHTSRATKDIGESFTKLQVGQAAFEQMGVSGARFRDIMVKIAEALGPSFDPGAAIKASADNITAATDKALLAEKALLEARIQLSKVDHGPPLPFTEMRLLDINRELLEQTKELAVARKAADAAATASSDADKEKAKAVANNLENVVNLIRQVEAGSKDIKFDKLTEASTKLEAVKKVLQDVTKTGSDFSQTLTNIIANLPQKDALAVGKALGFSDTDIDRVRRYGTEVGKITGLFAKINKAGVLIDPSAAKTFDAMADSTQRLDSAWARLKQAWDSTVFSRLGAAGVSAFNNIAAAAVEATAATLETFNEWGAAVGKILGQAAEGWGRIFKGLGALIQAAVNTPIENAWAWIPEAFNSAIQGIGSILSQATALLTEWVTTPIANAWQWIKDTFNAMISSLGFSSGGAVGGGGGGDGFASGGLLGGRGTGTSDSNLAWVSRGEYITPARAVAQPGVLAFLEALRRSGGNLRNVLDGMGRFALGGLVAPTLSIPALAGGGMNSVTINFPGLPEITGLRASSDVVDQLRKAAAMSQVRSGGRKPSRYS